ncbi:MAG: hypothetical protein ACLVGX_00770 [Oscillospiraceae bacterium]
MEDRPVQEGYHRPERKKKRAGLPAFFLAVIVLALLAAVVLRIWLGYRSGSLAARDITVLRRGLPFGVGAAGLAAVLAVAGLLRKSAAAALPPGACSGARCARADRRTAVCRPLSDRQNDDGR